MASKDIDRQRIALSAEGSGTVRLDLPLDAESLEKTISDERLENAAPEIASWDGAGCLSQAGVDLSDEAARGEAVLTAGDLRHINDMAALASALPEPDRLLAAGWISTAQPDLLGCANALAQAAEGRLALGAASYGWDEIASMAPAALNRASERAARPEPQFEICVGNWGRYAEGDLRDRWVALPMTDEELSRWIEEAGLYDPLHEETYVSAWRDGLPLGLEEGGLVNQFTSPHEANAIAKLMERAQPWELERVAAALECGADQPADLGELASLIDEAGDIPYQELPEYGTNMSAEERMARAEVGESDLGRILERYGIEDFFDYEKYARDMVINGAKLGEDGYLYAPMPAMDSIGVDEAREICAEWDAEHAAPAAPSDGALKGEAPKAKEAPQATPRIDFGRPPAPREAPRTPENDRVRKR